MALSRRQEDFAHQKFPTLRYSLTPFFHYFPLLPFSFPSTPYPFHYSFFPSPFLPSDVPLSFSFFLLLLLIHPSFPSISLPLPCSLLPPFPFPLFPFSYFSSPPNSSPLPPFCSLLLPLSFFLSFPFLHLLLILLQWPSSHLPLSHWEALFPLSFRLTNILTQRNGGGRENHNSTQVKKFWKRSMKQKYGALVY